MVITSVYSKVTISFFKFKLHYHFSSYIQSQQMLAFFQRKIVLPTGAILYILLLPLESFGNMQTVLKKM